MQAGIKVALIWGAGLLIGLLLRSWFPVLPSIGVTVKDTGYILPLNRLAFWFCLLAGLLAGVPIIVSAMIHDLFPP